MAYARVRLIRIAVCVCLLPSACLPMQVCVLVMCTRVYCVLCIAGMRLGDRAYVFATNMPETERDEDIGLEAAYKPLASSANAVAFPATVSAGFGACVRVHVLPML
jgi:hypothetical protein